VEGFGKEQAAGAVVEGEGGAVGIAQLGEAGVGIEDGLVENALGIEEGGGRAGGIGGRR
jgi:hypothetical protein